MSDLFDAFPYIGALAAGLLSFLSPCVLPLIPSYMSFITGISFEGLAGASDRKRIQFLTIVNSLLFVLGFSCVFITLGASSSFVGRLLVGLQDWLRIIGGLLMIFFGLFVAGFFQLPFLVKERGLHLSGKPAGYLGTFVVGMAFAAAWTPCIGPILGTILVYAGTSGSVVYGVKLLALYSLGLAIPFLFASLAFNTFLSYSKRLRKYMRWIIVTSGMLLVVFGLLLLTDKFSWLTSLFSRLNYGF
jgi:cytochrome c-type biogenesis protein